MAIEPESSAERKKLADALEMMKRQDPTFRALENEETGQTLISGMGELHLEVIKHRLLRDFNLNVRVHKPRVSYRETIERGGRSHRRDATASMAGQPMFAEVTHPHGAVRGRRAGAGRSPRPRRRAARAVLVDAVIEELTEQGEGRRIARLPADASQDHGARRRGARDRVQRNGLPHRRRRCLRQGPARGRHRAAWSRSCGWKSPRPRSTWATSSATCSSGGRSSRTRTPRGKIVVIEAEAPLANLFGYSSAMRSLSQGRATCSMEPAAYGPAPAEMRDSFV